SITETWDSYRLPHPTSFLLLEIRVSDPRRRSSGTSDESLDVILAIAERFLRARDLVFRYGENEILILLVDTELEEATSIGRNIQLLAKGHESGANLTLIAAPLSGLQQHRSVLEVIRECVAGARGPDLRED